MSLLLHKMNSWESDDKVLKFQVAVENGKFDMSRYIGDREMFPSDDAGQKMMIEAMMDQFTLKRHNVTIRCSTRSFNPYSKQATQSPKM